MAKVTIYVVKPFRLKDDKGNRTDFSVGPHIVDEKVAEHWFVKEHIGDTPVKVSNKELDALSKQVTDLTAKVEDGTKTIATLTGQVTVKDGEISTLNDQIKAKDDEITALKQSLVDADANTKALEDSKNKVAELTKQLKDLEKKAKEKVKDGSGEPANGQDV